GSAKRALRWRFAEARLSVEAVPAGDAKGAREGVAEFDYALGTRDKPAALDLTWRPPGFGGLGPGGKGPKGLGVIRVGATRGVAAGRARLLGEEAPGELGLEPNLLPPGLPPGEMSFASNTSGGFFPARSRSCRRGGCAVRCCYSWPACSPAWRWRWPGPSAWT